MAGLRRFAPRVIGFDFKQEEMMRARWTRLAFVLPLVGVTTAALGALQGSQSSTSSTGNFAVTVNAPNPPRLVQVLGISDVVITGSTGQNEWGELGVTTSICVVDTNAGTLALDVSTANAPIVAAQSWALNAGGGAQLAYRVVVTGTSVGNFVGQSGVAASFTGNISAGVAVTNSSGCGSGNVKIHVNMRDAANGGPLSALPTTGLSYTDTVTLTLRPL